MAKIPYYAVVNNGRCYILCIARPDGSYDPPLRTFAHTARGFHAAMDRAGAMNRTLS